MVSIPCSYPAVTSPPRLTQFSRSPGFYLPTRFHRHRLVPTPVTSIGDNSSGAFLPGSQSSPTTLFPGGFKRPEIKIPSLILRLQAEDVLRREDAGAALGEAVSRGVRIVVLEVGEQSGGQAYEAACILKSAVGDRAHLLIAERVDVAAAAGASGVLLSDQGIPAIVARNMMMKSNSDTVFLPIVARDVHTAISANNAAISDGADFIIMGGESGSWKMALGESFIKNVKVPIFFRAEFSGGHVAMDEVSKLLQSGVSGIVISLNDLKLFNDDFLEKMLLAKHGSIKLPQDGYAVSNRVKVDAYTSMTGAANGIAGFLNLNDKEIELLEVESLLLQEAVAVIRKAAPMMNEVALLVDAASRLKEPFLMVIVGEFNSGKSTVINALLGRKYLKEGVIPTTNEITLLCYSKEDRNKLEQCERNPDGHFICHLSAPILKNMNLVDTPGTNVILQRQQRLTEEFVPRADLILFVISSDRPLTQSEVTFLQFVQQWKKKIVFVLNKLDLYQNDSEIEEATAFVKENTKKLLNTGDVMLFPVSARSALEAKLYACFDAQNYEELLYNDPRWMSSKFHELEKFLFSFLDGSTYTGMERMKLKLDTPVAIAERLLESSERLVMQRQETACQDLISVKEVGSNVVDYAIKLENESNLWKKRAIALIETAEAQAVNLMESTLQLSNVDLIATYVFKGRQSNTTSTIPLTSALQNEIINPALLDMQIMLGEYSEWLQSNISHEQEICMEQLQKYCSKDFYNEDIKQLDTAEILQEGSDLSIKVMENFSASAATRLFEQEMREVFLGSFGGLGAAGLSASLLTSILPTTLEDLLALAFCSAGGFLAISSFPARREKAIKKVRKVANGLARTLEDAMREDFKHAIERLKCFVEFVSKPYLDVAQQRIDRLLETRQQVESTVRKLQDLKVEIQDLHLR